MISDDEMKRLRRKAKAANTGPWKAYGPHKAHPSWKDETFTNFGKEVAEGTWSILAGPGEISSDAYVYAKENAQYIAAADPSTTLVLLDEVGRLRAENARLDRVVDMQHVLRAHDEAKAKLAKARAALKFYGDLENWGSKQRSDGTTKLGPIVKDCGARARQALKEIDE